MRGVQESLMSSLEEEIAKVMSVFKAVKILWDTEIKASLSYSFIQLIPREFCMCSGLLFRDKLFGSFGLQKNTSFYLLGNVGDGAGVGMFFLIIALIE